MKANCMAERCSPTSHSKLKRCDTRKNTATQHAQTDLQWSLSAQADFREPELKACDPGAKETSETGSCTEAPQVPSALFGFHQG
jgi:hypothetical protein